MRPSLPLVSWTEGVRSLYRYKNVSDHCLPFCLCYFISASIYRSEENQSWIGRKRLFTGKDTTQLSEFVNENRLQRTLKDVTASMSEG